VSKFPAKTPKTSHLCHFDTQLETASDESLALYQIYAVLHRTDLSFLTQKSRAPQFAPAFPPCAPLFQQIFNDFPIFTKLARFLQTYKCWRNKQNTDAVGLLAQGALEGNPGQCLENTPPNTKEYRYESSYIVQAERFGKRAERF